MHIRSCEICWRELRELNYECVECYCGSVICKDCTLTFYDTIFREKTEKTGDERDKAFLERMVDLLNDKSKQNPVINVDYCAFCAEYDD